MSTSPTTPSVIEIDRVQMFTTAPGSENERSSLLWQMYNAGTGMGWNPRITVWTRVAGDDKKPPISAPMNVQSMHSLLDVIEEACKAEPGYRVGLTCEGNKYDPVTKDRIPGIHVLSKVLVGKDKDGCVWLSVISEDETRPRIQFKYGLGDYHHFEHKDGTRYTEAEISVVAAKASVRVLRNVLEKYVPYIDEATRKSRAEAREARKSRSSNPSKPKVSMPSDFDDITF